MEVRLASGRSVVLDGAFGEVELGRLMGLLEVLPCSAGGTSITARRLPWLQTSLLCALVYGHVSGESGQFPVDRPVRACVRPCRRHGALDSNDGKIIIA